MRHLPLVLVIALSAGILLWNFSFYEVEAGARHDGASLVPSYVPSLPGVANASAVDLEEAHTRLVKEGRASSRPEEVLSPRSMDGAMGPASRRSAATAATRRSLGNETIADPHDRSDSSSVRGEERRHGRWSRSWKNGRQRTEGQFKDGLRTGQWVHWFENGQVRSEGNYDEGLREGRWTEWHEDGTPKQETHYETGEPNGTWVEWYSNGRIKEHGRFVHGLREGFWEFYDFEGRVDRRAGFYENGRRME